MNPVISKFKANVLKTIEFFDPYRKVYMEVLAARTEHCFIHTDRDQRGRNDYFLAKKRKMDLGFKE